MIALALCILGLLDGTLMGFRAAAGRDGLVRKRDYYTRAIVRGASLATLAVIGLVLVAMALLALSGSTALWADFNDAGRWLLYAYVPYAALALGALAVYALPVTDLRALATVLVLGPFTMARPWVVVAGLALGVYHHPRWEIILLALVTGFVMLRLETWMGLRYRVDVHALGGEKVSPDRLPGAPDP